MAELTKEKFRIVGIDKNKAEQITRPNLTYWQDAWRRLKRNKVAMISLCVLVVIILFCIIQPIIAGDKYMIQDMSIANQGPSIKHLFGTDNLGRDLFDRLWIGGRVSLIIAFVGTLVECVVGIIYGGISGYFGGKLDNIMMRIVEVLNSIPYLIVVILIAICNLFVTTPIGKWEIMAPVVVPMMMQSNISPQFAQFILRAADSMTKGITPLLAYFVIYIGYLNIYNSDKETITIKKAISYIMPYCLIIALSWLLIIIGWYLLGVPIGIGVNSTL